MAHQKSEYRFVSSHHPPFTAVSRRQGDNPHMTALVPTFEKYHVSAAFLVMITTISTISKTVFITSPPVVAELLYTTSTRRLEELPRKLLVLRTSCR